MEDHCRSRLRAGGVVFAFSVRVFCDNAIWFAKTCQSVFCRVSYRGFGGYVSNLDPLLGLSLLNDVVDQNCFFACCLTAESGSGSDDQAGASVGLCGCAAGFA